MHYLLLGLCNTANLQLRVLVVFTVTSMGNIPTGFVGITAAIDVLAVLVILSTVGVADARIAKKFRLGCLISYSLLSRRLNKNIIDHHSLQYRRSKSTHLSVMFSLFYFNIA